MDLSHDEIVSIIRRKIAEYYDEEFRNTDQFLNDIHLISDDFTAIFMELEKKFGVKLDQSEYDQIWNVESYAQAIERRLKSREEPPSRPKKTSLVSRLRRWLGWHRR